MGETDRMHREIEALERENAALRARLRNAPDGAGEPGPTNPAFNAREFRKALNYYIRISLLLLVPLQLGVVLTWLRGGVPTGLPSLGPVPIFDFAGMNSGLVPGIGIGIVAFGGLAVGVVAIGGMAIGVLACGGGAIGVFAFGGGSMGLIAVGGGAVGLISIGGGAAGIFVCAERGVGRHVFSMQRQDDRAVEAFTRWLPRLRKAMTQPQPVIRLNSPRL